MVIPILKVLLVIVILSVMILVLLGINHFLSGNFSVNDSDVDKLRSDVRKRDEVISNNSIFTELVKVKNRDDRSLQFQ